MLSFRICYNNSGVIVSFILDGGYKNMKEKFSKLINYEGSIINLSNELQILGCEDICDFGNWNEILDSGDVVVATDEYGEEHIHIFFEVLYRNGEDEVVEATEIKIIKIEEF